jgi:hypothetical protein
MKTIREHFEQLQEPFRSQALENLRRLPANINPDDESLSEALAAGFWWGDSPQGYQYWKDVYFSLKEIEAESLADLPALAA